MNKFTLGAGARDLNSSGFFWGHLGHLTCLRCALGALGLVFVPIHGQADEVDDITAAVVANKAGISDHVLDVVVALFTGTPLPPTDVFVPFTPEQNSLPLPTIVDGTTTSSAAVGVPAVDVGPAGELIVRGGGTVSTSAAGAVGVTVDPTDAALAVSDETGGQIVTTGSGAAAIDLGTFGGSVFNGVFLGDGTTPVLSTSGSGSVGILIGDGTAGVATASIVIIDAQGAGGTAGMQTTGLGSELMLVDLLDTPSVSILVENSTLQTTGTGSTLVGVSVESDSDIQLFVEGSTLTAQGPTSDAISITAGDATIANVVILDTEITADVGLSVAQGATGSSIALISGTTITTAGSGVLLEPMGTNSNRNVVMNDSTVNTSSANGTAIDIGGLADGSAIEVNLDTVTATTLGDAAHGIRIGATGARSAQSTSLASVDLTTAGAGRAQTQPPNRF